MENVQLATYCNFDMPPDVASRSGLYYIDRNAPAHYISTQSVNARLTC